MSGDLPQRRRQGVALGAKRADITGAIARAVGDIKQRFAIIRVHRGRTEANVSGDCLGGHRRSEGAKICASVLQALHYQGHNVCQGVLCFHLISSWFIQRVTAPPLPPAGAGAARSGLVKVAFRLFGVSQTENVGAHAMLVQARGVVFEVSALAQRVHRALAVVIYTHVARQCVDDAVAVVPAFARRVLCHLSSSWFQFRRLIRPAPPML